MQHDLSRFATNIQLGADGLWSARTLSPVSYPDDGNQLCFGVEDDSFWFRHRNHCLLEAVKQYPPGGTLFDVGGGNGFVAQAFQQAGVDVVLVEPGRVGAENAKRRGIHTVVHATLHDAGFQPHTLPAAGLFDVLEHIEDDRGFLRDLHGYLKQNGRLYLTVPALPSLWGQEDVHAGHWRRYSRHSLVRTLSDSGFHVEYFTYLFAFLTLPVLLLRAAPFRLGLGARPLGQKAVERDHRPSSSAVRNFVGRLTSAELRRISGRRACRVGTSCLAVAQAI